MHVPRYEEVAATDIELGEVVSNPMTGDAAAVAVAAAAEPVGAVGAEAAAAADEECFEEVRVLDIKGRTFKLKRLPLSTTVLALKRRLEEESEVPVRLQRLIYGGRQLSDEAQTLVAAKVLDNTVVHLFQRPDKQPAPPVATPMAAGAAVAAEGVAADAVATATATATGGDHRAIDVGPGSLQANIELQDHRRRVRLLATLLLMVSVLNMVTLSVYLMDALFESLRSDQWLSLALEAVVNSLGVIVGMAGIKGTSTLNEDEVRNYCYGLLVVGVLYVVSDIWGLVRVMKMSASDFAKDEPESADDAGGPTSVDDPNGEDGEGGNGGSGEDDASLRRDDTVGAASTSLIFTVMIWSLCFYRAFQFRTRLRSVVNRQA
jgi:hypothetical protein